MARLNLSEYLDSWVYEHTIPELRDIARHELQVNRYKLERAAQEQQTLFEKWYAALEEVEGDLSDLNVELVRERSRVTLIVHRRYPKYKVNALNAKVEINKMVYKTQKLVNQVKKYRGALKGIVESARQRKSMIQALKDLYIANFWDKAPIHGRKPHKREVKREKG
jgi:Zn-dependent M32 family carboxypeptidase